MSNLSIRIRPVSGNYDDGIKFQLSVDDGSEVMHQWMTMQDLINLEGLCAKLRLDYEVGDAPKALGRN